MSHTKAIESLTPSVHPTCEEEVKQGARFGFGENWRAFLAQLNEQRIAEAELSLQNMLESKSLAGRTFIDVGSGSGLFSLAARRLGATVHSFDYDPASVWCAEELRRRYFPADPQWVIERGSALDEDYLKSLGQFEIVYSFGVLHHTGDMWRALALVASLVKPQGGKLYIAIYNDQGRKSRWWAWVKQSYCRLPRWLRPLLALLATVVLWWRPMLTDLLRLKPFQTWLNYHRGRGMSPWRDVIDWVGGYPFEVAKPEAIFDFYRQRGFTLCKLKTAGGSLANNHFVFERN